MKAIFLLTNLQNYTRLSSAFDVCNLITHPYRRPKASVSGSYNVGFLAFLGSFWCFNHAVRSEFCLCFCFLINQTSVVNKAVIHSADRAKVSAAKLEPQENPEMLL